MIKTKETDVQKAEREFAEALLSLTAEDLQELKSSNSAFVDDLMFGAYFVEGGGKRKERKDITKYPEITPLKLIEDFLGDGQFPKR